MRLPPLSRSIHIALLFVSHFFLGTIVAAWGTYQYEQSRWFSSLNQERSKLLLDLRVAQLASKGGLVQNTPESLQRDLLRLETIRRRAPREVAPLVDLRIAADHALLARRYLLRNDIGAANAQSEAARSLLNELGWKDTSDATLRKLAERRLKTIDARGIR
jgi:hypothetical protein